MEIKVQLAQDYSAAYITVSINEETEKSISVTRQQLIDALSANQVIVGIKEDAIKRIVDNKLFNKQITVAECIAPTVGDNARVEIVKKTKKKDEVEPVKRPDGEIDYVAPRPGFLTWVRKGEVVAIKYPPALGNPGKTVLGRAIPGKPGKEIALDLFAGTNTKIEGNELKSDSEGIIELYGIKVNVLTEYEIRDNVGINTGAIDLPLDLKVKLKVSGDIQKGFYVRCHSLIVSGCIEDAEVRCRNLEVHEGIVGLGDLPVTADIISVGYINGSRKIVSKSLKVLREISGGAEVCGLVIQAFVIQGSTAIAKEMIWADYMNGKNLIMVGVDYQVKQEVDKINRKLAEIQPPLEELRTANYAGAKKMKQLQSLAKINSRHPFILKELPKIIELRAKLDKFESYEKQLKMNKQQLEEKMYSKEDAFLLVRKGFAKDNSAGVSVDPNSLIYLRNVSMKIAEATSGGLFTLNKYGISSSRQYNIKEIKFKLDAIFDHAENDTEPLAFETVQKDEARDALPHVPGVDILSPAKSSPNNAQSAGIASQQNLDASPKTVSGNEGSQGGEPPSTGKQ